MAPILARFLLLSMYKKSREVIIQMNDEH